MKLYIFIHILCKFKECPPFTFNNPTNIYKYINGMIDVNQLTYMKTLLGKTSVNNGRHKLHT